jgi:hypothetical protein
MPAYEKHEHQAPHTSFHRPVFSFLTSHFPLHDGRTQSLRSGMVMMAIALGGLVSGCTGVNWERDQQTGLRKAVKNTQRAMIEFVGGFDEETSRMDREVFSDPEVVRLMQRFVAIRLNAASNKQLAEQFGVNQTPAFVVVRPDLTVSGMHQGTLKADQFRMFLIRNSLN